MNGFTSYTSQDRQSLYRAYRVPTYISTNRNDYRMRIKGSGSVKAVPDMAIVNLGVVTENVDLTVAQSENAVKMTDVIVALERAGIPEKDIETISYNIEPLYNFIDGKQIFREYKVTSILKVTIRQLDKVGEIIDIAVANGANIVNNVSFTISQSSEYYNKALRLAIESAVQKAVDIERSLNIMINRTPVSITEESYEYIPLDERAFAVPTPIISGEITINASIQAVFTYIPKNGYYRF